MATNESDVLQVPALAGDWRGQVGFSVESRWRGQGAVVANPADARAVECLADWRLLARGQLEVLAGLGTRSESVERLFRLGLLDRVTVMGVAAYTLSPYTGRKLGVEAVPWTAGRALRVLAANRVGEVLVRAYGGRWTVEPDSVRTARWEAEGQEYSVYAYRYWPGSEREALAVLQAVPGRLVMVVPLEADVGRLAGAAGVQGERVRWTWDRAVQPGERVQFWLWDGQRLVEAEQVQASKDGG